MAGRVDFNVGLWGEEKEGEEELEEDINQGAISSQVLYQMARQRYYESRKFAIGYQELQSRWRSQVPLTSTPRRHLDIPSSQPHLPHLITCSLHQDPRRQSLHLPLHSSFSSGTPSNTSTISTPSSLPSSCSLTSPNTSTLSTPTSHPSCSFPVSPSTPYGEHFPLLEKGCYGGEVGRGGSEGGKECEDQECHQPNRLLGMIREMIQEALTHAHLRRRRRDQEQPTPDEQVAILQTELEAYRVLSRSKKEAADLLKHELMAVLYERVLAQEEQNHLRSQLEREITSLEYQLHLQRTTAHHHLTHLSSQLHRPHHEPGTL
ncbi:uncharacterized protein LOC123515705 isoform X2 [Portunus trituberculatus]|uniref:uncharacterized protein LOC123515705 isoform X2 n=1 Tax=Portunus trituberculatus TaxID=210409 RepID=UPI001E1CFF9B|nr:uncharacterized protein LOC123515705 isoform X2 [Portunus trituberculatus]